ncbi:MAG TPA: type II toxin-antitoxin system VapC family toxin [Candidatus Dormibacteraeota bacterium]|nr:type II toxin-antitoxin system VapC family toxin [Candidatus Dormibacteraeota bacterium]
MKAAATKRFVLDASMTLAWCFTDESTAFTEAVLDLFRNGTDAIAPAIWPFEVANALLMGERRKRVTSAQVAAILKRVSDLPVSIDPTRRDYVFGSILLLARREQLTVYDASYIELALREGLPLATLDDQLRHAARTTGVSLLRI